MIYRGIVTGGVVVLEGDAKLPDGTPVRVEPVALPGGQPAAGLGSFLDQVEAEAGLADGPADWATEHDHYLYGVAKRSDADAK